MPDRKTKPNFGVLNVPKDFWDWTREEQEKWCGETLVGLTGAKGIEKKD